MTALSLPYFTCFGSPVKHKLLTLTVLRYYFHFGLSMLLGVFFCFFLFFFFCFFFFGLAYIRPLIYVLFCLFKSIYIHIYFMNIDI